MSENVKTILFASVAALLLVVALVTSPPSGVDKLDVGIGHEFFPEFDDPKKAASLEIVSFDADTGTIEEFKVAQQNGLWTLPSHADYPADAEKQLAAAAANMIDVKKLDVVAKSADRHEEFGVVDPDPQKLTAGSVGVGRRVAMKDPSGKVLAAFILGKEDPQQKGLYFVRVPGEDPVYRAQFDTSKLTTNFKDWIEKDLLKINSFDVKQVGIYDHSVDEQRGALVQRSKFTIDFDSQGNKWKLVDMQLFGPGGWQNVALAPDEELNDTKLNELKTALDNLQIVDVRRKPVGVSGDLRAGKDLYNDKAAQESLAMRGFYLAKVGEDYGIFSNQGEVRCGTNDGVEYILRFGTTTNTSDAAKKDKEAAAQKDPAAKPEAEDTGMGRFIMITAQFNESLLAKPELEPLPEEKGEETPKVEPPKKDEAPAADKPAEEPAKAKPAEECLSGDCAEGDEPKADVAKEEPAKEPATKAEPEKPAATNADATTSEKAAPPPSAAPVADKVPAADAVPATDKTPAAKTPDTPSVPSTQPPPVKSAADEKREAAIKSAMAKMERKRIAEENQKKQDEYQERIEEGKKKVEELNDRFADWYYVISEATYQKIHLSRDDVVIKKKAAEPAKDGAAAPDAGLDPSKDPFKGFDQLKKDGLKE